MKYAIYKEEDRLYAKEYYDKIDPELFTNNGVLGWWNIKPEDLPVVVNRAGGRCSFYPVEDNFVKVIEVEDGREPLTREQCFPKNSDQFFFGWISPEGDTYNSGFQGHRECAKMICRELGADEQDWEKYLEEKGWAKVFRDAPYTPENKRKRCVYAKDLFLTKKQADALFDAGMYDDVDVQFMIEDSKERW